MRNKIFLPIQLFDIKFILKNIKNLILNTKINFNKIEIKNHPSCSKSHKHLKLIKEIKNMINIQKFRKNKNKNISIFIGATGSVIEALERSVEIYHICENPEIEMYNSQIWKYIKTKKIEENIFKYTSVKKGLLINFANTKQIYKKYFYS